MFKIISLRVNLCEPDGEKETCSWFMKEGDTIASVGSFYKQKPSYERIWTP